MLTSRVFLASVYCEFGQVDKNYKQWWKKHIVGTSKFILLLWMCYPQIYSSSLWKVQSHLLCCFWNTQHPNQTTFLRK
jgi:hypothetical protein